MVNRQGLAVGLAVGVPSFIILSIVFGFWYRNQRKLRKEDLDDYIDKEIQNDDSSFQQFQEQLHKPQCDKKEKLDDGIQLKEHVVALNGTSDSSNGSLESVLHEPHHSQHSQHSQHLQHPQHPQHPQPVVAKPSKHPYGQHLQYTPSSIQPQEEQGSQSSSISLSQVSDVISNTYDQSHDELQQHSPQKIHNGRGGPPPPPPPKRQSSNKTSVYTFYDTFIPTFSTQEPSSQQQQQQQLNQNSSSSHHNSTHNSFSDLLNQTAHSSLNILKHNYNKETSNNVSSSNQHKHTNSSSDSNTSLLQSNNHSASHSRAPSTDLGTLAKQLNNPVFFEKLPSKAAAAQGKVYIKPRVPSANQPHNNSSSELINNYLVGENTAINDHFTYEAPMVETAKSTDNLAQVSGGNLHNNVLTYNQHLAAKGAKDAIADGSLRPKQPQSQSQTQAMQEANPLNGQIGNAFDANITMEPMAMNKKNATTNDDEDVMPPVVFQ
ncbi:hypothetical protein FOB58_003799 [Candida parapsilosis]|uniref:Uncharacterized protein n=2 Tax=Candida parapsilosis TaxID=5480 RepID=G8B9C8_CANPC|nr:uncharacterized protein CPAR2_302170 [Candida parapsilosis]KAF6044161.1 hypothetical protein FOB60_005254 [Candida parapsilosis]KAF6047721.1 hypothetical protein FOB58_003799 [Candida parapsilosis]KAF6050311.1 hypothetical protein FOB59_002557 [Candida parapsilosis]KAF6061431.1 hypothetical protein FOB61_004188 [Candida parapsilosis]KAI5905752.1 hypothetical protein K4G60_g5022 [Candida parapsilosis]